jgi:signal transduction histidine kinase
MAAQPPAGSEMPSAGTDRSAMVFVVLFALAGIVLVYFLTRTTPQRLSDESNLREWFDEAKVHRKTLPELVAEYVDLRDQYGLADTESLVVRKREEIAEQLLRLADPTRLYQGQLPLFPEIYNLQIAFPGTDWAPIVWDSPLPKPRPELNPTSQLTYRLLGEHEPRVELRCEYRLHVYNARQKEAEERQSRLFGLALVLLVVGLIGLMLVVRAARANQRAEHQRNIALEKEKQIEHQRNLALEQENRAAAAERAALELESQLFAGIGITAGSYAHNIKNLLVRPNDLLNRCIESDGLSPHQATMLQEVKATLGSVTERVQQILRTVSRDPSKAEKVRVDVNAQMRDLVASWGELARDKWKIDLVAELAPEQLWIQADASNLVQTFENLLFNARDATFEMRNWIRQSAHQSGLSDEKRRQALLEAAAWRGRVTLRTRRGNGQVIVEVSDNGIGMSEEVRRRCTETHFSTKRDNAIFEGYTAGTGLGLSFVAVVLKNHGATLEVDSQPRQGTTFRIIFPEAASP